MEYAVLGILIMLWLANLALTYVGYDLMFRMRDKIKSLEKEIDEKRLFHE